MFELWGQPQYSLVYQLYGIQHRAARKRYGHAAATHRRGRGDCARQFLRLPVAEGTKGDMPRNVGADFKFLIGSTMAEYKRLYRDYRRQDRELVDNWYNVYNRPQVFTNIWGYYNSIGMTANPGAASD